MGCLKRVMSLKVQRNRTTLSFSFLMGATCMYNHTGLPVGRHFKFTRLCKRTNNKPTSESTSQHLRMQFDDNAEVWNKLEENFFFRIYIWSVIFNAPENGNYCPKHMVLIKCIRLPVMKKEKKYFRNISKTLKVRISLMSLWIHILKPKFKICNWSPEVWDVQIIISTTLKHLHGFLFRIREANRKKLKTIKK